MGGGRITLPAPRVLNALGLDDALERRRTHREGLDTPLSLFALSQLLWAAQGYTGEDRRNALERLSCDDPRPALHAAALDDQPWLAEAAAILAVAADLEHMRAHFAKQPPRGQRGTRYAHIEAGALAQNAHLEATALNLGFVLSGGFDDEAVAGALTLEPGHAPLALLCVGGERNAPVHA